MADDNRSDDLLSEAKGAFKEYRDAWAENHAEHEADVDFARMLNQWPDTIRKQRETDGRPCLTVDRLGAIRRQVVNDGRQNRPSIKTRPVDSKADPKTAEIFDGYIRNIEVQSDADVAYDTALESAVDGGFGFFRINTEYCTSDGFEQDLRIRAIPNPLSVYPDPWSTAADSSDWMGCFVVDRMSKARFKAKYKGAEAVDWDDYANAGPDWFGEEGVTVAEWWVREEINSRLAAVSDLARTQVMLYDAEGLKAVQGLIEAGELEIIGDRVVQTYRVTQHLLTGAEVLKTTPWPGKFIPIVPVWGDVIHHKGRRHFRSLIRPAKDEQRRVNYSTSQATELIALAPKAPFIGPVGAFDASPEKWASANVASYAYLEYKPVPGAPDGGKPERQGFAGVPAGLYQEALSASDNIKAITGVFDASLGARSNETSGKAILARKAEGDTSNFHFHDNQNRAIRHGGRILLDLIPKVVSTARVIRTLGLDGKPDTVQVNAPYQAPKLDAEGNPVPQMGPDGVPKRAPDGSPVFEMVEHFYDLTAGEYDLVVDAGPSFISQREEAASQMMELIRVYPAAAPIIADLLAKNLDWPGADEIAKRLRVMLPPAIQQGGALGAQPVQPGPGAVPPEVIAKGQQLIAQLQEENQRLTQQLTATQLQARDRDNANQIAAYRAETERMTAQHRIQEPTRLPRGVGPDQFGFG